jgi:hypothetical protein
MSDWLSKLRTHFWEIKKSGERYATLRKAKNRLPEHLGKYTIEAVGARVSMQESVIRKVESGALDTPEVIASLVKDLGITQEQFDTTPANKIPKVKDSTLPVPVSIPALAPVKEEPKAKAVAPPATKTVSAPPIKKSGKEVEVVSHGTNPIWIRITGGKIHLYDIAQKGDVDYVYPADIIPAAAGGRDTVKPRSTMIRGE